MRPELELIEKIEQFLKGELTGTGKAAFERQMAVDPSLREEVSLQQDIMKGIERSDLQQKIQMAKRNFKQGRNFTRWGLTGLSILVIVTAAFLFYKNKSNYSYEGKSLPEYNEAGEKQWADADRNISAQTFIIDASKDTVIETKGGIVIAVPANGFLDKNGNPAGGNVELVVKEALDPATMMNAGLSTKSGDNLLESGGMFFIDARKNGDPLKINPANGIYAEVPTNEVKAGMQLFRGKRMADGTIDWTDPTPLEHDLLPVDIQTLNFYPPNYLDSLQRWGYDIRNKKFTDSLYYSFARLFGKSMPKQNEINSADIMEIVEGYEETVENEYIGSDLKPDTSKPQTDRYYPMDSIPGYGSSFRSDCGINPSKIKAIWNEKFNNTIISTREFEERLRLIHNTSDVTFLDLYLNNLDKSLYYIDSLAALKWRSIDATNMFAVFASRHDGKVKNGSAQFELLKKYYENKTQAYTEAIAKTQNEFWNKQEVLNRDATGKRSEYEMDSANRMAQNLAQEFDLNLKEAYRQLGYDTSINRITGTVYSMQITATGWYNVDKYVYESTVNRTTLDYTDPQNGKKATINYNPVSIRVNQWNEYDRLYVYLLPDKLNSFMRVNSDNGTYSEKLDELMKYDLICIAYKDEQAYFFSQKNIQPKDYSGISLTMIGKDELDQQLNKTGGQTQSDAITKENDFFRFDITDMKRQKHNMVLQELTYKIGKVIFTCYNWVLYSQK